MSKGKTLEFPEFYRVYFHNLFIIYQALFFMSENPCPFASPAFEVTLSGLAGGDHLPFPASKGLAFPLLLTLDGPPTSPAIDAQGQRFSPKIKETPGKIIGLVALITFCFGMTAIGNAVAGLKVKCRNVWYLTKWEQVEADYQEGDVVAIYEHKRILSRTDRKTFVLWECGLLDRKPTGGRSQAHRRL